MLGAELFMMVNPAGRGFKALRYVARGAKAFKNARKAKGLFSLADASQLKESFGTSMLKASNGVTDRIFKGVKKPKGGDDLVEKFTDGFTEGVIEEVQNAVLEMLPSFEGGALAVVEASFGQSLSESPEYQLGESEGYKPLEVVYDALSSGDRRHLRRNNDDNSNPELMVNIDFGISDAGAHSAILSSIANSGLLTASNGFDVGEFGLFDESTAIIQECTYIRHDDGTAGELQECKEILRGADIELYVRMVVSKSLFSTNSHKNGLIAAVRNACDYSITNCGEDELDVVKIVKEIDVQCPGSAEECVQVDMKIGATTAEMKQEFLGRLSLQAMNGILFHHHNLKEDAFCNFYGGGGQRRDSDVATRLFSFVACPSKCGACPQGMYGAEVETNADTHSNTHVHLLSFVWRRG